MAGTITTTLEVLRAQLQALEAMYCTERRCETARRILDLIHIKRDEISAAALKADRRSLDVIRLAVA